MSFREILEFFLTPPPGEQLLKDDVLCGSAGNPSIESQSQWNLTHSQWIDAMSGLAVPIPVDFGRKHYPTDFRTECEPTILMFCAAIKFHFPDPSEWLSQLSQIGDGQDGHLCGVCEPYFVGRAVQKVDFFTRRPNGSEKYRQLYRTGIVCLGASKRQMCALQPTLDPAARTPFRNI